jgi:type 2 lantibiotic biosynthesis protein LanM
MYYLPVIEKAITDLGVDDLVELSALIPFFNGLIAYADECVVPAFAHEIALAKAAGHLRGTTSGERYTSFFVHKGEWTEHLYKTKARYGNLFGSVHRSLESSIGYLKVFLGRLRADFYKIRQQLLQGDTSSVESISLLSADRHRGGQQPMVICLKSGKQFVYKPVDLTPDLLWGNFIDQLELPEPFDLRYAQVISRPGYGWIEFIEHRSCENSSEVADYYCRAGVLLAVADFLNYSDGHVENLIAAGEYPVLIDCETLFQPAIDSESMIKKSILSTYLVQTIPEDNLGRFGAALQAPSDKRTHLVHPYVVNDRSDEMQIRFRGFSAPNTKNNPMLGESICLPHRYIEFILKGYEYGFDCVTKKAPDILGSSSWEASLAKAKPRFVLRSTVYYAMLIRLIQQPVHQQAEFDLFMFLKNHLAGHFRGKADLAQFADYEVLDVLNFDVPYFYHTTESTSVFDALGREYSDFFFASARECLDHSLTRFSDQYLERNLDILACEIAKTQMFDTVRVT